MSVKVTVDRVDALLGSLKALTQQEVLVGIPAEAADRDAKDGDKINNAALLYLHENGAPAANIPARPTLIPGIKAYEPRAVARLKAAANAAMDSALEGASLPSRDVDRVRARPSVAPDSKPNRAAMAQLNAIGLEAVSSVKKQFTDGGLTPLKPATIVARKRAGFQGESPLIRTSDLMRHITFAIRKRK